MSEAMSPDQEKVMRAVRDHGPMSQQLLKHIMRGGVVGSMTQRGLLDSLHRGAMSGAPSYVIHEAIATCMDQGWLVRSPGDYPGAPSYQALSITATGREVLKGPTQEPPAQPEG